MFETLLKDSTPIADTHREKSAMDVVEGIVVSPVVFNVVDQELAVGRHEGGLDRGKVNASDLCCRVLFSEFDCPETSASANIQDFVASWGR